MRLAIIFFVLISALLLIPIQIEVKSRSQKKAVYLLCIRVFCIPVFNALIAIRMRYGVFPEVYLFRRNSFKKFAAIYALRARKKQAGDRKGSMISALLPAIWVRRLAVTWVCGLQDAASTALVCGLLRIFSDIVCALLQSQIKKHEINTAPDFCSQRFLVWIHCIILAVPANIIMRYLRKRGKEHASDQYHTTDDNVRA